MAVSIHDEGSVRVVILDRPRGLNALDPEHFVALDAAVAGAMLAEKVRVVVLAAVGRTFSIGADLAAFHAALTAGTMPALLDELLPVFQRTILSLAEGIRAAVERRPPAFEGSGTASPPPVSNP